MNGMTMMDLPSLTGRCAACQQVGGTRQLHQVSRQLTRQWTEKGDRRETRRARTSEANNITNKTNNDSEDLLHSFFFILYVTSSLSSTLLPARSVRALFIALVTSARQYVVSVCCLAH